RAGALFVDVLGLIKHRKLFIVKLTAPGTWLAPAIFVVARVRVIVWLVHFSSNCGEDARGKRPATRLYPVQMHGSFPSRGLEARESEGQKVCWNPSQRDRKLLRLLRKVVPENENPFGK